MLVNFINKLNEVDDRALWLRNEHFGIPKDAEATDRTPARVQDKLNNLVDEYVKNAFSTPNNTSQTQEEDEDINVYEPEYEYQEEVYEPEAEVEEDHLSQCCQWVFQLWRSKQRDSQVGSGVS